MACDIRALEERAFSGWPALHSASFGGWVFRASDGCTKRANSANALAPSETFDTVEREARRFYDARGLPRIFRLSPLAPPDCDRMLAERGYMRLDESIVMVAPIEDIAAPPSVEIAVAPSVAWLDGLAAANAIPAILRDAHHRIVRSIRHPAAFATVHDRGAPAGYGLAVCERGMIGLFDIVISPAARGKGLGKAIVQALMGWGGRRGAASAYLQVTAANARARSLYEGLGFGEAYRYHYRISPAP